MGLKNRIGGIKMKTIRLDAMTHQEIKEYLEKSYTTVALIEF